VFVLLALIAPILIRKFNKPQVRAAGDG